MMVRAVENLIAGVGGEGREEINSALLQQVCLIPAGRAIRQLVLPDLRRRRDQAKGHWNGGTLRQPLHIREILLHLLRIRCFHPGDQCVPAEIHAVEL